VSTKLLLAPTGHGKTEYALSRIRAARAADPLAPIWVLLPNQIQVRAFGQRLGASGGALGVELGTFYRFYGEILARSGQPSARLPDAVLHRLLLRLVDQLAATGQLRHYAPLRGRPGFARLLRSLFQELKQARVQREPFSAAVAEAPARLAELAVLYAAYQDWLTRSDWLDAEGQGWLAALALEHDPTLAADLRLLVVDGFDEFNPTQLAVLAQLADRAAGTLITLTGDLTCEAGPEPSRRDRLAHRRFCRARDALQQALNPILNLPPTPNLPIYQFTNPLSYLESNLFQSTATCQPATEAVSCLEAPTRAAEARAALRWLKARLVRDGFRLDEVALLARTLEPYRPYLAEVAAEFGLPLHLAGGQPLAANPAVAALLNLLSLPATDWPRRPLLDALSSPYFDWSACGADGDIARAPSASLRAGLDAVARAGQVIAGLDQWREALSRLARLRPRDEVLEAARDDEELAPPDVPAGEQARCLQSTLDAVAARLNPPFGGVLRDYAAWIEDLIGDDPKLATRFRPFPLPRPDVGEGGGWGEGEGDDSLRLVARAWESPATAERDVAALRRFKDVLRGLVLAEAILPDPGEQPAPTDYARFFAELRSAVEAMTYEPPTPPPGSALLAAPLLYARGLSFRAVALLGLSEGEFPQPEREDPLLTESDRAELRAAGLPLESRLQGDEASLFYEAVTRARERLFLTRPYLADDGQPWEPSPYWDEVQRLVDAPPIRLRPQDSLPLVDAASLPEAHLAACRAGWQPAPRGWERIVHAAEIVRAREAADPAGPWEGDLGAVAAELAAHYSPEHTWSASRLEAYAACPFLFLVGQVLGLEPRLPPAEGYDIRILGTIYHEILEKTYRRARPDSAPDHLRALLPQVAAEVFAAAPDEHGFRPTALWARQREELARILAETLEALIEATAGWQTIALEQAFGLKGRPALDVSHEGRRLRLRGFVDRLDRDADGRLQVIDYKAGSTPISARDLESGKRVQLPLYALAVRDALGLGEVGGGFYWHINSARPSSLRLEGYLGGVEFAIQTALEHALDSVDAVRAGQFPPKPPASGCPANCPAAAFCWRYAPRAW
jgi:ATP-dependent helicase/DNAse subunit B